MNPYREAMEWLAGKDDCVFVGQGVGVDGHKLSRSLADIDPDKRIEFPVAEELQLGACIGLALEGFVPVSVFPRWNFLLCAMSQLVNHLDALPLYSAFRPKVLVRTAVGAGALDPGPQHDGDFTEPVDAMLRSVNVLRARDGEALSLYQAAYNLPGSFVVVDC